MEDSMTVNGQPWSNNMKRLTYVIQGDLFYVANPVRARRSRRRSRASRSSMQAVISRCRLDGTYDINYDDGEKETGAEADLGKRRLELGKDEFRRHE